MKKEDEDKKTILLLGKKLADIVYALSQVDEYAYIESVVEDLEQQIEIGYNLIAQYDDWEVEM